MFLEQVAPDTTSVGAWRAGPSDEIFGRYGRSAIRTETGQADGIGGYSSLKFLVADGAVLFASGSGSGIQARVVYLDTTAGASFKLELAASSSATACTGASARAVSRVVTGKGTGHWVEARVPLADEGSAPPSCGVAAVAAAVGRELLLTQLSGSEAVVFNLVELSREGFGFALSPWVDGEEPL